MIVILTLPRFRLLDFFPFKIANRLTIHTQVGNKLTFYSVQTRS
jgi:hypothetical protein